MILTRYDKKLHNKTLREEGIEEGREEERTLLIRTAINNGIAPEALALFGIEEREVKEILGNTGR
ncbi:MAG: hypothetical protein IKQ88_00770 [Lachnospiraceae bacterium]|nr:hypothetical protein [Lachnospiraceae bacterium]